LSVLVLPGTCFDAGGFGCLRGLLCGFGCAFFVGSALCAGSALFVGSGLLAGSAVFAGCVLSVA
jgi:hypothetical protein